MPAQITVHELKALIDRGDAIYLLDVRQAWEHDLVHLPGDVFVPLDQVKPPEGSVVVTYCHHGVRSLHAATALERIGIRALSLAGGIDAWSIAIDPKLPRY